MGSGKKDRCNGAFYVDCKGVELLVIASDGSGWIESGKEPPIFEHVSVSIPKANRCPTWEEMAFVKKLFWAGDEAVVEYHVPAKQHVNNHEYCLHLWKPVGVDIPLPNPLAV